MHYVLLIYNRAGHWQSLPEEERNALYEEYDELSRDLHRRGKLVASHELQPSSTAASVRICDGETVVVDGPFAETKEQLGGYYVVEAESIDEAIEWAARIPSAQSGVVEVRPAVMEHAEVGV